MSDGVFGATRTNQNNGVIRIGKKGIKKFAFGDDGPIFEVDIVVAFQEWIGIDEAYRIEEGLAHEGEIPTESMADYHRAAVAFAVSQQHGIENATTDLTVAEALDFIARLREQYNELATFFRPRSPTKPDSPATSEAELRFSAEAP